MLASAAAVHAKHRKGAFGKRLADSGRTGLRIAYADPPYPGQGHRYPEGVDVDHKALIERLEAEFPDGWALSTSALGLNIVLPLCPPAVRVGAWVKLNRITFPGVSPQYSWEPVIFVGGRRRPGTCDHFNDSLVSPLQFKQDVLGQKPLIFAYWLFGLLHLTAGDEFIDLFPGSGAMTRAWQAFQAQPGFVFGRKLRSEKLPLEVR